VESCAASRRLIASMARCGKVRAIQSMMRG
jgi:hypothetical protein